MKIYTFNNTHNRMCDGIENVRNSFHWKNLFFFDVMHEWGCVSHTYLEEGIVFFLFVCVCVFHVKTHTHTHITMKEEGFI